MRIIAQLVCASFFVLLSAGTYAQSAAEKEALDVIEQYWEARNNQDFKSQADLASAKGTLDANSDGSFFRTSPKASAEELAEQLVGSQSTRVFYPEATELGDGVVMVRYYPSKNRAVGKYELGTFRHCTMVGATLRIRQTLRIENTPQLTFAITKEALRCLFFFV
jgi:hypothetical protein